MIKLISYIFIYMMLIGCEGNPIINSECESDCYLQMDAPNLEKDARGYYHMEWLDGYYQTFSTLDAETGSTDNIVFVGWSSDSGIWYSNEWVSSVNPASYTNNGMAHTVLSAWEEQIGDTITVYSWFTDGCEIEYSDSLKVVIHNEF